MGKVRRGGFVFVTWKGDHSPYHVHVYRDGTLVVKWDLENDVAMKGEGDGQSPPPHRRAPRGGYAVKIESVHANNRKKAFEVETEAQTYAFPYALLSAPPSAENRVAEVAPDEELGGEGFTYRLQDGQEDTVHLDAVLEYNEDPAYLKDLLLHRLTLEAQAAVDASDLSKRELTRALGTSATQLYRLLDPANHTKSVGQLIALLHLLGRKVDVVVTPRGRPSGGSRRRRGKAAV